MSALVMDNDLNDDLIFVNKTEDYSSFMMDELFPSASTSMIPSSRRLSMASDNNDILQAPPPSPQQQPMLDMLFSPSLESCLVAPTRKRESKMSPLEHAGALDKLLRKTLKTEKKSIGKSRHRRSCSAQLVNESNKSNWQYKAANQRIRNIAKATELTHAFKQHLTEEETASMIKELREMGL
ncbi:hypothetical protein A0J61_04203 [Choanephora cucurbitarum]|uniref:Uncharacterized protein n=1 Tax=Choanephora cucurbitarum TaxID=101091 RepID=A0A1C7NKC9_9FUNG|nr:hypothetical protein A0J61_04203 [Choanephora cucurbitarum]